MEKIVPDAWVPGLIRLRGKKPFEQAWNTRARERWKTPDPGWYERVATHVEDGGDVGLTPPPGVVALDADNLEAVELLREYATPDVPWMQRTPERVHAWFRYTLPFGVEWLSKGVTIDGAQIDIRPSCKGQCVIPPSKHISGAHYAWETPLPENIDDIPMMPEDLIRRLIEAGGVPRGTDGEIIPTGQNAHDTVRDWIMDRARRAQSLEDLREAGEEYCEWYVRPMRPDRWLEMTTGRELEDLIVGAWERVEADRVGGLGLADERFVNFWRDHFPEHWVYTGEWNAYEWKYWDGSLWVDRPTKGNSGFHGAVVRFRDLLEHAAATDDAHNQDHGDWAGELLSMAGMLHRVQTARGPIERLRESLAVEGERFDNTQELWNCPAAPGTPAYTINFGTTEVRSPQRGDYLTKRGGAPWMPGARSDIWDQFTREAFPDEGVRRFVQVLAGYSMLGNPRDDVVPFLIGKGGSGKSTFLDVLRFTFGDYAGTVPPAEVDDGVRGTGAGGANASLVQLQGRRLAVTPELPETVRLGAKLKGLTGGDIIEARQPFARIPRRFRPTFVLWLGGNLQPKAKAIDTGLQRRVRYVPMDNVPAKPDVHLRDKLHESTAQAAVMQWLVKGLQTYLTEGIIVPPVVLARTEQAQLEASDLGPWMAEMVTEDEEGHGFTPTEGVESFITWYTQVNGTRRGCPVTTSRHFGAEMSALGHETKRIRIGGKQARRYTGLRLRVLGESED